MTREFVEKVFARIPKGVKVGVFGLYDTGCGGAEICVSWGVEKVKDATGEVFENERWKTVAIDDEIVRNFDAIVAKAVEAVEAAGKASKQDGGEQ